jgi:toxin ParE1/3/4
MTIEWTRPAISDLIAIRRYIALHSPPAAEQAARRITEAVERLATFPASGQPGRKPNTRELVISDTSYLVVYGVRSGIVHILRVLHTAQRPR